MPIARIRRSLAACRSTRSWERRYAAAVNRSRSSLPLAPGGRPDPGSRPGRHGSRISRDTGSGEAGIGRGAEVSRSGDRRGPPPGERRALRVLPCRRQPAGQPGGTAGGSGISSAVRLCRAGRQPCGVGRRPRGARRHGARSRGARSRGARSRGARSRGARSRGARSQGAGNHGACRGACPAATMGGTGPSGYAGGGPDGRGHRASRGGEAGEEHPRRGETAMVRDRAAQPDGAWP
jgi:hypothetical protein